ncbi:hypothetical protein DEU56DRAFT_761881 [Suillus clintonianus]|uniref:uncharacterized protein n=1 Tax=Suillus clintonianus TaxID=1904413 RepID=UPI001B87BBDE|nr:uncharacterized protein DEU56DRAFT_761881 [Suillus clintonianus]KAG2113957.1 hypothetical protein DEU56DRAFT_761881 [Suillus clintonianus]
MARAQKCALKFYVPKSSFRLTGAVIRRPLDLDNGHPRRFTAAEGFAYFGANCNFVKLRLYVNQKVKRTIMIINMEYSANDLAAARTLQYLGYVLSELLLPRSNLTAQRLRRYFGPMIMPVHFRKSEVHTERELQYMPDIDKHLLMYVHGAYSITCALWNNDRMVLVGLLSTLFATFLASMATNLSYTSYSIHPSYTVTTSAIPGITGCYGSSRNVQHFIPFLLLFVFQLGLVSLTLIRVMQNWRLAKGPLHVVLVKHNIYYYACGLFLSAVNILVPTLSSYAAYDSVFQRLEIVFLAILATRMHLHLWHMDKHTDGSDILVQISLPDICDGVGASTSVQLMLWAAENEWI